MLLVGRSLAAILVIGCSSACISAQSASASNKQPIDYANPLVGTAPLDNQKVLGNDPPPGEQVYSGFTSPGAVLPQGPTNLAPINRDLDLSYTTSVEAPYYYPYRTMIGFTGGSDNAPTVMPVVGNWNVPPERNPSVYDKSREKASPGYYSVYLNDFKVRVEMTVTTWTGLYRFTFPETQKAHIVLNLGRRGGNIEIVGDRMVRGVTQRGMEPHARKSDDACFVAEFSRPFKSFGVFRQIPPPPGDMREPIVGNRDAEANTRTLTGHYAGAYLQFTTTQGEQILMKIASGRTYAIAEAKLKSEDPGWNFDSIKSDARNAWAKKLNLIEVKGGTEKEKMLFYSCLFLSFSSPRLVARKGEQFTGRDGEVTTATYDRYGGIPFWDTGRNQIVLLTMLEPTNVMADILRSQLDMARESGHMSTSFHGDHADLVYLGAWERGIPFDREAVYEYLRKNAVDVNGPRPYLAEYLKQGWISDYIPTGPISPTDADGRQGVANTLEYSWDDHALAIYAKKLGKEDDYHIFLKRAHNYRNLFDPANGFMVGRTADGQWVSPFYPGEPYYNFMMKEASGWSTMWLVPHDIQGLANLLGGRDKFRAKLDEFFNTPYDPKGVCDDCTGLIGQYVQGNQPDQQVAYYYDWAGEPWKTQELTRKILKLMYGSDYSGYAFPGMDDQGSTSSWYVMSAMGFYPVDPSTPDYIIGSPIFDKVTLHMGNGKDLVIIAHNNSAKNIYIQSATLNGKPWNKPWFSQSDIASGAQFVFQMGPRPNKNWGAAPDDAPPSMSKPN